MKEFGKLVLALLFAAAFCLPVQADPYAPKPKVPEGSKWERYWTSKLDEITTPQAGEVGIPVYPGALVIGMEKIGQKTINGTERTHPVIYLISSDDRAMISEFYKQNLADWKHKIRPKEEYFWTGEDYFSPAREPNQNHPSLILSDLNKNSPFCAQEFDLMPSAKTKIRLTYSPSK